VDALILGGMDAEQTCRHATRRTHPLVRRCGDRVGEHREPRRVGYVVVAGTGSAPQTLQSAILGILSVAASWFAVHTLFTVHYARLYYSDERAESTSTTRAALFSGLRLCGYTVGMTYQVSDTEIGLRSIRGRCCDTRCSLTFSARLSSPSRSI